MRCVPARDFTVGKALAWRSSFDADVAYQRQGSVWSLAKQQLFIDSLLNGYDVPKIYLHDLRGAHPTKVYAIVDGKQRLTTIWRFLSDGFPLAADYRTIDANLPELPPGTVHPAAGQRFSELHPAWQKELRGTFLAVVLVRKATEADIEDLFSRLNNGEPLNAAEKRNALGGAMAHLIREVARHPFFTDRLPFGNERHEHFDLAAKVLRIEQAARETPGPSLDLRPDLGADALDDFVRAGRHQSADDSARLKEWALVQLAFLCRVFIPADPLLASGSAASLLYLFVKRLRREEPGLSPSESRLRVAGLASARARLTG